MDKIEILKRVNEKIEFFIVACKDKPSTESELEQMMDDTRPDFSHRPSDGKYGAHSMIYGNYAGKKPGGRILFEIIETGPIRYKLTQEGEDRCKLIWDNIEFGKQSEDIEEAEESIPTDEDGVVIKTNDTYVLKSKCSMLFDGWFKIGKANSTLDRISGIMASTRRSDSDQIYKLFNPEIVMVIKSDGYGLEIEKFLHRSLFPYNCGIKQGAGRSTEFFKTDIDTIKKCLSFLTELYPDMNITIEEV